ncbi:hypothetical protein PC123_g5448 [Phytophthora cactorum]|nr:hypothetical protein PC123_g5448 [Phytophthora cactorum]
MAYNQDYELAASDATGVKHSREDNTGDNKEIHKLTAARSTATQSAKTKNGMSMSTKKAEVLLSSGNYFRWEFNMLMALARMRLLAQVEVAKPENEVTEAWLVKDTKAPGIIAQGVELQHQTKSRSATRAMQA